MCAIFGSSDVSRLESLYKLNKERGSHAYALLEIVDKEGFISKGPGELKQFTCKPNTKFFVGHTQAPTSCEQHFSEETSHPFKHHFYSVAHNGIITNYRELQKLCPPGSYNNVDSSVIPPLLMESYFRTPEISCITDTLLQLEGTYSMWIWNHSTTELFLTKNGSTLFINDSGSEFSSVQLPGMNEIPDGSLYQLIDNRFKLIITVKSNSPFLIL